MADFSIRGSNQSVTTKMQRPSSRAGRQSSLHLQQNNSMISSGSQGSNQLNQTTVINQQQAGKQIIKISSRLKIASKGQQQHELMSQTNTGEMLRSYLIKPKKTATGP